MPPVDRTRPGRGILENPRILWPDSPESGKEFSGATEDMAARKFEAGGSAFEAVNDYVAVERNQFEGSRLASIA
jgi:hypothetical protein